MTTYSLRSASPAKTRADAVVVGVVAGPKGPLLCDAAVSTSTFDQLRADVDDDKRLFL